MLVEGVPIGFVTKVDLKSLTPVRPVELSISVIDHEGNGKNARELLPPWVILVLEPPPGLEG